MENKRKLILFKVTEPSSYRTKLFPRAPKWAYPDPPPHDRCFSILVLGAFSTGFFNTNALPRINIGADVWGESSIMTGVY